MERYFGAVLLLVGRLRQLFQLFEPCMKIRTLLQYLINGRLIRFDFILTLLQISE